MFIIPHASSHGRRIWTFASSDYSSDCLTTWLFRHIYKHVLFFLTVSCINNYINWFYWHQGKDSNLRHTVLETVVLPTELPWYIKKGEIKKMLFQDYNILNITRKEVNGASTQNRTENRRLQVYRFAFKLWKHVGWIVGLEPTTIHQYNHQLWTFYLLNYIHHIIFWLTTTVTASP